MPDLSVIILSYNTKNTTRKCIESLHKSLNESNILSEIIIIENNSVDGSYEMVKKILENSNKKIIYKAIFNKINYGYAKGNNQGIKIAKSRNILFLNSDVIIQDIKWDKLLYYFVNNPNIGALTVKVNTLDGNIDQASHRGFPTVWNAFTYYSKLEKIFGKVPVLNIFFGGYHLTKLNLKLRILSLFVICNLGFRAYLFGDCFFLLAFPPVPTFLRSFILGSLFNRPSAFNKDLYLLSST